MLLRPDAESAASVVAGTAGSPPASCVPCAPFAPAPFGAGAGVTGRGGAVPVSGVSANVWPPTTPDPAVPSQPAAESPSTAAGAPHTPWAALAGRPAGGPRGPQ